MEKDLTAPNAIGKDTLFHIFQIDKPDFYSVADQSESGRVITYFGQILGNLSSSLAPHFANPTSISDVVYYCGQNPSGQSVEYIEYSVADESGDHTHAVFLMSEIQHAPDNDDLDILIPHFLMAGEYATVEGDDDKVLIIPTDIKCRTLSARDDIDTLTPLPVDDAAALSAAICYADSIFCSIAVGADINVHDHRLWLNQNNKVSAAERFRYLTGRDDTQLEKDISAALTRDFDNKEYAAAQTASFIPPTLTMQ